MLLINKTLWRLARGLWGWIITIALLKVAALAGTALFARTVSGFLGNLLSPAAVTAAETRQAVVYALLASLLMLASELLTGEAEYRCTAKARTDLRAKVFSKVLALDVGNIEKLGPVSAITSAVDGVEAMTVYYSKYLPGLLYSFLAPVYLFFQMKQASLPVAVLLFCVSFILMPVNNLFRSRIEKLKRSYWDSMEDMTGYYLENVRGLTTIKLFGQDGRRTDSLRARAQDFNRRIMAVMRVNFTSFLLTDGLIYGSVVAAIAIAGAQLAAGSIDAGQALTVLMLSFGFFSSVRVLMNATHSALAGVSAADKMERVLDIDTERPYDPGIPAEAEPWPGILMEHVSFSYEGRAAALRDVTLAVPKGKVTALAGLSGCGKSTAAALMMRFSDVDTGRILLEGRDLVSMSARLSGGEKQRVGIARTLLTDPDVIVMDEPTSSLDVLHEKELLQTLAREYKDKMLIIVSHRPSTLTGCTRIIRLEGGKAVEM